MAYFIGLFWTIGSAFMTWRAVQLWRSADLVDHFTTVFSFLPFGKEVKRGEVRSLGLTAVSLWGVTILFVTGSLDVEMTGSWLALILIAAATVLVCLMCEISVVLFNLPKFVVPPHMRSDLGVLAARRARRANSRRGPRRS
ncbi:hypothetical protein [Streptomyces sp. NPDC005262]|uniref:hypothetical protein n=1 Tax=Streptomyces sp. NPDC005262 TaxID=3364710 RepID=UPI0036817F43